MRKLSVILLSLALMAGLAACGTTPAEPEPYEPTTTTQAPLPPPEFPGAPEDFTGMDEAALAPYLALAEETARSYVTDTQFPLPMSEQLEAYMARRALACRRNIVGHMLRSFEAETSWEIIDGKLLATVGVNVEFQYDGVDFISGFGTGIQLLIENPRAPLLIDWFEDSKFSWDRAERGVWDPSEYWTDEAPHYDLRNPEHWLIHHTFD